MSYKSLHKEDLVKFKYAEGYYCHRCEHVYHNGHAATACASRLENRVRVLTAETKEQTTKSAYYLDKLGDFQKIFEKYEVIIKMQTEDIRELKAECTNIRQVKNANTWSKLETTSMLKYATDEERNLIEAIRTIEDSFLGNA